MESQFKSNIDGTQMEESRTNRVHVANPKHIRSSDFLLRLLTIATTLAAALVMGLAKETKIFPVSISPNTPPIAVLRSAKMSYSSALVYFVAANGIACACSVVSLLATMGMHGERGVALGITVLDVIMVGLLFSGNGAAATIGVLGHEGNSHVEWNKVCNRFEKFCHRIAIALTMSMIGSVVFVLLVVLSIIHLYRRSR